MLIFDSAAAANAAAALALAAIEPGATKPVAFIIQRRFSLSKSNREIEKVVVVDEGFVKFST